MSKLIYALLGAGALAGLASVDSRFAAADTLSVSGSSSISSSSSSSGGGPPTLDCSNAVPSLGVIWPPDHKMVAVTLIDVAGPNVPTTITVTGIQQDEPVNALGSGNTAPDGSISSDGTAYVRAERAGPGTGRIYFISFMLGNTAGQSCSKTVQVYVPHDQGQGFTPVDTGLRYDSTVLAN